MKRRREVLPHCRMKCLCLNYFLSEKHIWNVFYENALCSMSCKGARTTRATYPCPLVTWKVRAVRCPLGIVYQKNSWPKVLHEITNFWSSPYIRVSARSGSSAPAAFTSGIPVYFHKRLGDRGQGAAAPPPVRQILVSFRKISVKQYGQNYYLISMQNDFSHSKKHSKSYLTVFTACEASFNLFSIVY